MYHGQGLTAEDMDAALAAVSLIGDPEIQLAMALQGERFALRVLSGKLSPSRAHLKPFLLPPHDSFHGGAAAAPVRRDEAAAVQA
jgi:hypothetical protein